MLFRVGSETYLDLCNIWNIYRSGAGFSNIQIPEGYDKTFAEFTDEDQNKYDEIVWKPAVFDSFIDYLKEKRRLN